MPAASVLTVKAASPQTPMQQLIKEVWEAALGVEGIGPNDNFFDLGGHSLLSMQVIRELQRRTGALLTPREMVFLSLGQLASIYEHKAQQEKRPTGWMNRLSGVLSRVISKGE
jgi:hypothetical protein